MPQTSSQPGHMSGREPVPRKADPALKQGILLLLLLLFLLWPRGATLASHVEEGEDGGIRSSGGGSGGGGTTSGSISSSSSSSSSMRSSRALHAANKTWKDYPAGSPERAQGRGYLAMCLMVRNQVGG